MSVIEWIVNDLKLPREYASNLMKNGFEEMGTVMMQLSEEALKEFAGVENKAHRMKIMMALQKKNGGGIARESEGIGESYFHHK